MKQNKWIVTSLLLLAGCLLPDRAAAQWKVGVSAGYAYNQYSIDTQYAYDFNFDGRGGVTVGIPVEYGILDWLAVRADFVYLQKGYSMQRAYDQGFRDRRDHYLSLPVMARFSFGGEKLRGDRWYSRGIRHPGLAGGTCRLCISAKGLLNATCL